MFLTKVLARLLTPKRAARSADEPARAALAAHERLSRGDIPAADALLRPLLERRPPSPDVVFVQGLVHKAKGELEASIACFRQAIRLREDFGVAWSQLGLALRDADDLEQAVFAFEKAAALLPDAAEIHQHLGITRYQLRDVAGAIASTNTALSLQPDMSGARFALAEALLAAGDFARGWAEYEHRPHLAAAMSRVRIPRWRAGHGPARIAVIAEQGLGDVLMFARLLPRLREVTGQVAVFVQPPLFALMRESGLADDVGTLDDIEAAHAYDAYVPFMSLPHALGLQSGDLHPEAPYLAVSAERERAWQSRLGVRDDRLRVGLAWGGNATHARDSDRSIAAAALAPLAEVRGVEFHSLQVGRRDLGVPPFAITDATSALNDLADTAALIGQLDLVISVDSATAHLAGALGRPVWVLGPHRADWRWEICGQESPWYASARVFRPSRTAEWPPVIARMAEALAMHVAPPHARGRSSDPA